jgi:hypothetical protein
MLDLSLTPEQAKKAAQIIIRLRRSLDAERRFDERVQQSLARVLAPLVRAEVDRVMGRN